MSILAWTIVLTTAACCAVILLVHWRDVRRARQLEQETVRARAAWWAHEDE